MSALGVDKFRFESNLMHYRGRIPREDGFPNYGEYLKDLFAREGLEFVSGEALAQGPNELLDWAKRIVTVTDELLVGAPLSAADIQVRLQGATEALIQFGSTAISDYHWAQTFPDTGVDELIDRRAGGEALNWFEWEQSAKAELRRNLTTLPASPESFQASLQAMKAIELTGDPIMATGDALATVRTLINMSKK